MFEHVEMMVLRYDITGIGLECTINELIVIRVSGYKAQMEKDLHHSCVGQVNNGFNYIGGNLSPDFLRKYLFILCKNLSGYTEYISRQRNLSIRDSKGCDAKATSAGSWCQEQCSSLVVRSTHVFVLPLFHHPFIESSLVPKMIKGIFSSLGKIPTKQDADIAHLYFRRYSGNHFQHLNLEWGKRF